MAGRGSAAGLLAFGNVNEILKDMAREVLRSSARLFWPASTGRIRSF
jgi:predicted TIM-barrel enzyme